MQGRYKNILVLKVEFAGLRVSCAPSHSIFLGTYQVVQSSLAISIRSFRHHRSLTLVKPYVPCPSSVAIVEMVPALEEIGMNLPPLLNRGLVAWKRTSTPRTCYKHAACTVQVQMVKPMPGELNVTCHCVRRLTLTCKCRSTTSGSTSSKLTTDSGVMIAALAMTTSSDTPSFLSCAATYSSAVLRSVHHWLRRHLRPLRQSATRHPA